MSNAVGESSLKLGMKNVSPYDIVSAYRAKLGMAPISGKKKMKNWVLEFSLRKEKKDARNEALKRISSTASIEKTFKKNVSRTTEDFADEMRSNPTPAEKRFKEQLEKLNSDSVEQLGRPFIEFEFQKVFKGASVRRIADFYFPEYNTIVEIDGGHHYTFTGIKQDLKRENELKFHFGIRDIIRIKNEEIFEKDDCFSLAMAAITRSIIINDPFFIFHWEYNERRRDLLGPIGGRTLSFVDNFIENTDDEEEKGFINFLSDAIDAIIEVCNGRDLSRDAFRQAMVMSLEIYSNAA